MIENSVLFCVKKNEKNTKEKPMYGLAVNEIRINAKILNKSKNIKNGLPAFSKIITDKLTNTQWQLEIKQTTQNNIEWLGIGLMLIKKTNSIQSIEIGQHLRISDTNGYNVHSMGATYTKYTENGDNGGYSQFVPLNMVTNWKEIKIECWLCIQNINGKTWMDDSNVSVINRNMLISLFK